MAAAFFFKPRKKYFAVLDIGSASVGGAILELDFSANNKKEPARVIFTRRRNTNFEGPISFQRFWEATSRAIQEISAELNAKSPARLSKFHCFISSPFYLSQTKIVHYCQENDFLFSQSLMEKITLAETSSFTKDNEGSNSSILNDKFEIVENKVMSVALNGYPVINPFGKKASKAVVAQFLSGGSGQIYQRLRQIIAGQTHGLPTEIHSFSFAAFSLIRDIYGRHSNFVVIDVSGELTDVIVTSEGILKENVSFPLGVNSIVRGLAKRLGSFFDETKSTLVLFEKKQLQENASQKIGRELANLKAEWIKNLKEALATALEGSILPEHVVVMGSDALGRMFLNWVREEKLEGMSLSLQSLQALYFDDILPTSKKLSSPLPTDSYLVLESLFCAKMEQLKR